MRGHRDQITSLAFVSAGLSDPSEQALPDAEPATSTSQQNHLISSSKDTLLKLWDLPTQHCISTVVAHRTQVWSFATFMDSLTSQVIIISGGGEGEAKAWCIDPDTLSGKRDVELNADTDGPLRAIRPLVEGLLPLRTLSHAQRIAQVAFHPAAHLLAFQTTERTIEILRLRTEVEIRKKAARRQKREREKRKGKQTDGADLDEKDTANKDITWKDRLASWVVIRTSGKIRSFDFGVGASKVKTETTIMAALSNNAVEVYQLPPQSTKLDKTSDDKTSFPEATRLHAVELPGHRTDIRTLSLSSDDALLASGDNGTLKIWNVKTTKCLRTMECGYSICSTFLPGDRHLVVGTKTGELHLYDVGSSTLLETFKAHQGSIWGVCVRPDGKGMVSGSADKDIKFWDFEIKDIIVNPDEADMPAVSIGCLQDKAERLIRCIGYSKDPFNDSYSNAENDRRCSGGQI